MNELKTGAALQGGKYRIERVLGQGGFGITYLATHVALGRKVAIKEFFMKELCNRDGATQRVSVPSTGSRDTVGRFRAKFVKEAQTIAALDNPHIIRIHDIFEENGTAYYVMDYLGGGSLADIVRRDGPMDEATAISYIRQIADALGYIHARRINHLDIKPSNILVGNNGQAIVIDFGLSKRYDATGSQTSSTPVGISHGYAPLEQYQPGGVSTFSPSTDIYSLGATLYKLLSATTPPNATSLLDTDLDMTPVAASPSTKAAIAAAMQPKRKDRPQTVEEFLGMMVLPNSPDAASTPNNGNGDNEATVVSAEPSAKSFKELSEELKKKNSKSNARNIGTSNSHDNISPKEKYSKMAIVGFAVVFILCLFYVSQRNSSTTSPATGTESVNNGPGDLGLSVIWATENIGAKKDCENGYSFAFEPIFNAVDTSYLKSLPFPETPEYFNDHNHDPAVRYLGGGWRLPSEKEMRELVDKCKWHWTMKDGVEGANITGPNGNSIFLPAAGVFDDYAGWGGSWRDKNKVGFYLTKSTVLKNDSVGCYRLIFSKQNTKGVYVGCENSFFVSARPVKDY